MKQFAVAVVLVLLTVAGCKTEADVPPIAGWEQFGDQFFRASFTQPVGWEVQRDPSRITITSSLAAMEKFFDPYSKNDPGAQLTVAAERTDSVRTLQAVFDELKQGIEESGFRIDGIDSSVTIEGHRAIQIEYGGRFDERTSLKVIRAMTYKDTTTYYVQFAGFNEYYKPYRAVYDSALASLMLPKPIVKKKGVDPSLPVAERDRFSNQFVEFTYPTNFSPSVDKPSTGVEYAMSIKGYRQDSYITLDIRSAQGLALDKVVEQNKERFRRASSPKSAKIGSENASYLDYSPVSGVNGRVYFMVKNDKFYRVIMVYPASLARDFRPAFEETIASLKLK